MTKSTVLDILLPVKNEEIHIARCLKSINKVLGYPGITGRVILVNDMSSDRTIPIAKKTSSLLSNLELQIVDIKYKPKKTYLADVLNQGLQYIESSVFLRLDADMMILKSILKLYKRMKNDVTIGAIGGKMPCIPNNLVNETLNIIFGKYLLSNGLFKTELVKEIGYHTRAEDTFLYGKIQELGYKTEHANIVVGIHQREHTFEDFKKLWESYTLSNIHLGFPRWYPFARLGRAMLRCLISKNIRAFLLCSSVIRDIKEYLNKIDSEVYNWLKEPPYWKNGQFSLLKYLRQRK